MALTRPENLWTALVNDVRTKIDSGEYAPGQRLPSEAQMIAEYAVSRTVVRQAIAALRVEGLVTVEHGRGAFVRDAARPTTALHRSVIRTGTGTGTGTGTKVRYADPELAEVEEPSRYRTVTDETTGPILDLDEGEAAFGTDRLLTHEASGARLLHRVILPFATADGTDLETDPHRPPAEVYAILAAAGHTLAWTEQTSARMPTPDEASTLRIAAGVPMLVIRRITYGAREGQARPLVFEETRAAADAVHLVYTPDIVALSGSR